MKNYKIEIMGESQYEFNVSLSKDELAGVLKVLATCNELADYNDVFTVIDVDSKEELLDWM